MKAGDKVKTNANGEKRIIDFIEGDRIWLKGLDYIYFLEDELTLITI